MQPQASAFYPLLSSPADSDDVVAQEARVREIDNEIFKYVGVSGVDRPGIVQAALVDRFLSGAEAAAWSTDEINRRLWRIVRSTPITGIHAVAASGEAVYSSAPGGRRLGDLVHSGDLAPLAGGTGSVDHPTPTEADGPIAKHVTLSGSQAPRMIQVGYPIDDGLPVSPRFGSTHPR